MRATAKSIDPVELTQALIRCPSVTPADAGAIAVLEEVLTPLGFECRRLRFGEIENLYAKLGSGRNFCFAGHTDVVPPGDAAGWASDPFGGEIRDGRLYGRGAADMKGGIAAFVAAVSRYVEENGPPRTGAISLLITGDEEGPALDGTRKVLEWLAEQGERLDACVVGEPTNPATLGDMIKIGRRGSLTGYLTVPGTQGHVAYPDLADNPLPRLVRMLAAITAEPLDKGSDWFQPSTLQITTIDVGNPATNVIPAAGRAAFNIRFNDLHSSASLIEWLRSKFDEVGGVYDLRTECSGESFLTQPGALSELVAGAVERVTGKRPELSTTGGTSDARFICAYCPVVEFGIVGQTMHKMNENVLVEDLHGLTEIYAAMLSDFFAPPAA